MTVSLKRLGRGSLAAIAALSVLVLPGAASATPTDPASPPDYITVELQAFNGTGCKPGKGTTATALPDRTGFRISFKNYVAKDGGGTDAVEGRRNCQMAIKVGIPQGFTFAIAEARYRGIADLQAGADGVVGTTVYFQGGSGESVRTYHTITGPRKAPWSVTELAPVFTYAPCSETHIVNVDTELRAHAGPSDALSTISMSSATEDVDTLFNFSWKHC